MRLSSQASGPARSSPHAGERPRLLRHEERAAALGMISGDAADLVGERALDIGPKCVAHVAGASSQLTRMKSERIAARSDSW
jgi:hypothetical protein